MIKNEKIRAAEVELTGLNGEQLGIVPTSEALAMAKRLKVDLVCLSLMSSPPPCKLIGAGAAKQEAQQARKTERQPKVKEIRLTPQIEDRDYETKKIRRNGSCAPEIRCSSSSASRARKALWRSRSSNGCCRICVRRESGPAFN